MSKKEVTMKDTKQVIFEKLQEVQGELDSIKKGTYDPRAEKKVAERKEDLKKADEIVGLNILSEEIMDKYNSLNKAIEIKEAELKDLYEIDAKVTEIAALIESKKRIGKDLEADHEEMLKKLRANYAETKADLDKELEDIKTSIKELKTKTAIERKRDEEEYQYNLKRERKIENDKWEDKKAQREAELAAREKAHNARVDEFKEQLDTMEELKAKVAEIPSLIEDAKTEAADKTKKELERVHAIKEASMKKEIELDKKLLEAERDTLKKALADKEEEVRVLNEKLEAAQSRVETIATTAVNAVRPVVTTSDK